MGAGRTELAMSIFGRSGTYPGKFQGWQRNHDQERLDAIQERHRLCD